MKFYTFSQDSKFLKTVLLLIGIALVSGVLISLLWLNKVSEVWAESSLEDRCDCQLPSPTPSVTPTTTPTDTPTPTPAETPPPTGGPGDEGDCCPGPDEPVAPTPKPTPRVAGATTKKDPAVKTIKKVEIKSLPSTGFNPFFWL